MLLNPQRKPPLKTKRLTPDKISKRISHAQSTVLNTGGRKKKKEEASASLVLQENVWSVNASSAYDYVL